MTDRFADSTSGLDAPASHGFSVTPDDAADLAETTRALYVGTTGDIAVVLASGAMLSFGNVASGSVLPLRTKRVMATGTTAAGIVGLV
jgi:hypothetical protein